MANAYYTTNFMAMGTRCDMVIVDTDSDMAERIARSIQHETLQLEHLLSRYNPDGPVAKFNALSAGDSFEPDASLWAILTEMQQVSLATFGVFDVTAGAIIRLWKDMPDDTIVHSLELEKARSQSGFDKLSFDHERRTVTKLTDGLELDFGAVGKGIALDKLKDLLIVQKVSAAFISFGESSILGWGKHPNGPYWPVGIPNPMNHSEVLHTFQVLDESITTSGSVSGNDAQGFRRRRHLVDPRSGESVKGDWLVSVKSDSALKGEVISSIWGILNEEERLALHSYAAGAEVLEIEFLSQGEAVKQLTTL